MNTYFPEYIMEGALAEGTECGIPWLVISNGLGYRCAYISLPKHHPWADYGDDQWLFDFNIEVHGGITYNQSHCDRQIVGFDCAHASDLPDPALDKGPISPADRTFSDMLTLMADVLAGGVHIPQGSMQVRSQEYVEEQVKLLCKQAKDAYNPS